MGPFCLTSTMDIRSWSIISRINHNKFPVRNQDISGHRISFVRYVGHQVVFQKEVFFILHNKKLNYITACQLLWRHNDSDGVSNHQPHDCLLDRLFGRSSKKTSKLRVIGLCEGNSPVTGEFPHKGPVTRKMFRFDDVIMNSMESSYQRVFYSPQREEIYSNFSKSHLKKKKTSRDPGRRFYIQTSPMSDVPFHESAVFSDLSDAICRNFMKLQIGLWCRFSDMRKLLSDIKNSHILWYQKQKIIV